MGLLKSFLFYLLAIPLVAFYAYNLYAVIEWFVFGYEPFEGTSAVALTHLVTIILMTIPFVYLGIKKLKYSLNH